MLSIVILGVGILIGAFVVGGIVWAVREDMKGDKQEKEGDLGKTPALGEATQFEKKEENLKKILELLKGEQARITNNAVEKFLKVSDSTATRYLDELEKQGSIKQIGKTGKYTYYEKI
ncbi:MAG: hypothetical protein A2402_02395 [Candidatus Staskawiczbacteria bacterium RIFOXYC1_FULL_37_43]|nr:MAG: hypothetical protein A2813_01875 [Candidatus Staskawiczbacteria bacterium RIFCSPHIGHO2_01_FULL_37_17]OGZ71209.1 MAG: hypothetical protein A2891_03000 [Candidatus Staskawiczbacteria bacterium RIFCSPLOWO2_01_FULL_37_19]OGZ75650.1 MAG: hypothetical protein A2205_00475 [Candidatus Staskawiczbacteria bacterium RIFOXYA1_FULL_37_15]OGZ77311.1 MAG: hypothetical protein A2280_01260 [Candidatus Staskawiczbacteria bacterium RIFOXYA12_FULL_37_10]OGZ79927.1 MAG: hypothetical protein A2353_01715 [Can